MSKHFTRWVTLAIMLALSYTSLTAQCAFTATWGGGAAPTGPSAVTLSTCNYAGEYAPVSAVVSGSTYSFTGAGIGYITITNTANAVLSHGPAPHVWTATVSGDIRVHFALNAACGTDNTCHATSVTCTSCGAPAFCVATAQYGSAAAPTTPAAVNFSTCNFAGEFAPLTGTTAGTTYALTGTGIGWIVVTTTANALVTSGVPPLAFTPATSGDYRVHFFLNSSCGTDNSCHVTSISCTSCAPPPPAGPGDNCSNAIDLATQTSPYNGNTTGFVDDFQNACAGGNTSPDMIFFIDVPSNYTLVIGQTVNGYDSENNIFYGGACPGTTQIACFDDPDVQDVTWENTTGVDQRVYWVQDGYFDASNIGTFTLAWTLTPPPTCIAPSNIVFSNITTSGADMAWTCSGCVGTYDIEYGPAGFTPGNGGVVPGVAGTTYSFTGLPPSASVDVYITQNCDVNGFSTVEGPFNFQTALANDFCADAITLNSCTGSAQVEAGSTIGSTVDANYINCGAAGTTATERGVWYIYNGDDNAVTMTTCDPSGAGFDSRITVYSGPDCNTLSCVVANDDMFPACATGSFRSEVSFNAYAGTTYYVFVHGYQFGAALSTTGTFNLNYTCSPLCLPLPTNDECATAQTLTVSSTCTPTSGNNTCASAAVGNPSCLNQFLTLPDVWYTFVATDANHDLNITYGSAVTLAYAVYDGCGGAQLACGVATSGANNTIGGLTVGNTYLVQVLGPQPDAGTFSICVWENACPDINTLTSSAVTATSVNLAWVANGSTSWDVYAATSPATAPTSATTPTAAAVGSNPYTLSGLMPTTAYSIWVRNACVGNTGTWVGPVNITTLALPPSNDEACNAIPFTRIETSRYGLGATTLTCSSILGSTTNATNDPVNGCGGTDSRAVWYQFTAPDCFTGGTLSAFNVKFSTRNPGTNYDSRIAVFSSSDNTCNGTFTNVYCNDDSGVNGCVGGTSGLTSTISAPGGSVLVAGQTYWVRVSGFGGTDAGNFELTISVEPAAPTLTNSTTNPTGIVDATWPDVNAGSYRLYWRPTGGTGYAIRTLASNTFSVTSLIPNTSYDYWVNNWCGATFGSSFASPIATLSTAAPSAGCSVPTPTCAASTATTISLNWPEITGAVRIGARFSFAGQAGYNQRSVLAYTTAGGVSSFEFVGLQSNMAYTFTLFVECDGRIFWAAPITCSTGIPAPRLAADIHSFQFEGTEYVDVRMTDFEFFAPAAGLPEHIVDVSSGNLEVTFLGENASNEVRFTLTPNVTTDLTTLTVFTAKTTDANIVIYDVNGAMVHSMSLGEVSNGQQIPVNTGKLAAGVYHVNVRTGNTMKTEKLVIVR